MDSPIQVYPAPGTLDDVLGFQLLESSPEGCRARFDVEKRVQQPLGLVHGGAYAALAESMVSATTHMAVAGEGNFAVGQSNSTHFFRPATEGRVHAEGMPIHRGRTSWVWDVRFTDDEDRLCAASRVTIAVRPATAP
ncbi:MAG: 1,4-dihydroxy-2-naphthoyl-CoA hydrolase [Thermoleophilaceae bacterium]|nr:1,4-dihydroxy-2-naphthoyl-CoA hydrolase [Thermoleophilaceae bacterium]